MKHKKVTAKVGLPFILWWGVFAGATYAFSLLLQAFKAYTLTPTFSHGLGLAGAVSFVILALLALVYDSYAKEKVKGNVMKPFALFEWLFSIQYKELKLERGTDHHASIL